MKLLVATVLLMASAAVAAPLSAHGHVPASSCADMLPVHGNAQPSTKPSPYTITVTPTSVSGGDTVRVHISGTDEFRGVYLQARKGEEPVGEFLLPNGETNKLALSDCPPGHNNAFSYISRTPLDALDIDWKAPNTDAEIVFRMKLVVAAVLLMAPAAMAAPATKPFDHRPVMSSVCETMTPAHGNAKPSQDPSPYTVTVTPTSVNGGDTVRVHIKGSDEFKGVYMQARRENGEPVGEFLMPNGETSGINLSDCRPGHNNAYTHISYDPPLKELDVDWKAPNSDEKIVFRATFVKSFSVFWVGVESEEITVKAVKSAVKGVNAAAA